MAVDWGPIALALEPTAVDSAPKARAAGPHASLVVPPPLFAPRSVSEPSSATPLSFESN